MDDDAVLGMMGVMMYVVMMYVVFVMCVFHCRNAMKAPAAAPAEDFAN